MMRPEPITQALDDTLMEARAIAGLINFLPGWGLRVARDQKRPHDGRIFLQWTYEAPCVKTREVKEWRCAKHYLSAHMTEDELVKTAFAAGVRAMEHEAREHFTYKGRRLFNPHLSIDTLARVCDEESDRANNPAFGG